MTTINKQYQTLVDNLRSISRYYYYEGRLGDAIHILKTGIETCHAPDMDMRDQVLLWLDYGTRLTYGIFLLDYTLDTVLPVLDQAQTYIDQIDNQDLQATCLTQYGRAHYYQFFEARDFEKATSYLEQARRLQLASGDPRGLSESTLFLGLIQQFSGNKDEASRLFKEAYTVADGFPLEQSYAILHIGLLEQQANQWQSARMKFEESIHLRQSVGFKIGLPFPHIFLGDCLVELGQLEPAHTHYEQAQSFAQQVNNHRASMFATLSLGIMYHDQHNNKLAKQYLIEGKEIAEKINHTRGIQLAEEKLESLNPNSV